ncbi:MAG: SMC-Scp complex subunit ScpB [Nanoarchaeota archaeon]
MDIKKQVEAILFTLGKFVSVDEIAKHINSSDEEIIKVLNELKKNYELNDSSLAIQQQDNLFKLNIKKEYGFLANKLLGEREMDSPTTKTLAVIAYKAPVDQSEIIKIRGNKAYDHIKSLAESGFITSEKKGRTRLLKLTAHFYDYFDISEKEVKDKLKVLNDKEVIKILEELPSAIASPVKKI